MVKRSMIVSWFLAAALAATAAQAATAEQASPGPTGPLQESAQAAAEPAAPSGVVNINTATLQQLQLLPGVGPARAQAILAYREQHPFRRTEELLTIRGIGRATLNRLLPYVTVDGQTTLTRSVPGPSPRRRSP